MGTELGMDRGDRDVKDDPDEKYLKDPKDPNAWWAVPYPSFRYGLPKNLSRRQKLRLCLIFAGLGIVGAVEFFYMHKLMK